MNDRPGVMLLNDSFPPVIDGVANAVVNYARILTGSGIEATVATPAYPGAADDYPFRVLRYPSVDTTRLVGYRTGVPFSAKTLAELGGVNAEILHSHCPVVSTLLARVLREMLGAPVIMTYHTKFDIDIANAIDSGLLQSAAMRCLADNIAACDEVWTVSRGAGESLRRIGYEGDFIVMENGVDFPRGPAPEAEAAAVKLECGAQTLPMLLFVGRLMWYKGIRIILDGLDAAKAGGARFRMVFVGDGGDAAEIKDYTASCGLVGDCVFTGAVRDRERLRAYFSAADLFLFPSTFDTNGLVVREAAACGLASVLIRDSCAAEGVTDGLNGILIDENAHALGAAVTRLCQGGVDAAGMGCRAMDTLYVSWADAVRRARQRYGAVLEDFRSRRSQPQPTDTAIIRTLAQAAEALEKAREARSRLSGLRHQRLFRTPRSKQ